MWSTKEQRDRETDSGYLCYCWPLLYKFDWVLFYDLNKCLLYGMLAIVILLEINDI